MNLDREKARTRRQMIADYTTIGLGVVGLDWATAHRIATEIVDEKLAVLGGGQA